MMGFHFLGHDFTGCNVYVSFSLVSSSPIGYCSMYWFALIPDPPSKEKGERNPLRWRNYV